jgi:hypothetical protein
MILGSGLYIIALLTRSLVLIIFETKTQKCLQVHHNISLVSKLLSALSTQNT